MLPLNGLQGIFQSTLIATVLGTHISSISAINPELRSSNKPIGALVLSIQAVSHHRYRLHAT